MLTGVLVFFAVSQDISTDFRLRTLFRQLKVYENIFECYNVTQGSCEGDRSRANGKAFRVLRSRNAGAFPGQHFPY